MVIMVMVLLEADGMVHIIVSHTRREGSVMSAVIWKKHHLLHLITMEENLQSMVETSICQLLKKENSLGLSTCAMIQFASFYMLVLPQMLVADGVLPNQLA